jgi:aspartyl protease family protein
LVTVSNALKFAAVVALSAISAVASAGTLLTLAERGTAFRAASAEAAVAPAPPEAPADSGSAATIAKGRDGHYWASAQVNGARVRFLVDTGATAVALTADDARRLGLDLSHLDFAYRVVTASGESRAAPVKLASIDVGGAKVADVDALVIDKGLDTSLLGMTYLGRLSSFQATRQSLILRP